MIRVKISFVKKQVMPLISQYRPDLHQFCIERKHPFDFARELLNIYFRKPLNNMRFAHLDISQPSLSFLDSIKEEFNELYILPQTPKQGAGLSKGIEGPIQTTGLHVQVPRDTRSDNEGHTGAYRQPNQPGTPYTPQTPPPPPVWNNETGRWDVVEPVQQAIPPPPPLWDGQKWVTQDPAFPLTGVIPEPWEAHSNLPRADITQEEFEEEEEIIEEENEHVDPEPATVKMKDVEFDPKMFIPLQTGTLLDDYMSFTHGIMPATNIMVQGPAGSGKSSVLIDIACMLKAHDPEKRILFVSGEMTKIDMKGLVDRFDGFEDLDILFLNEYADTDTRILLDTILESGWDMVIMDSFSEVLGSIIDTATTPINTKSGEKWLINQFLHHNQGGNELGLPTMFFFILQVGKDGRFVGSNRIKHAATAFMNIEFTNNSNLYIYFSKNRRGETYNNLYFEHYVNGIHYDFDRYKYDIELKDRLKKNEMNNKTNWKGILDANKDGDDTKITSDDQHRTNLLVGAIEHYDEDIETRYRRISGVDTAQINLEDMIEEVETEVDNIIDSYNTENTVINQIDGAELNERVDEIIEELGITDEEVLDEVTAEIKGTVESPPIKEEVEVNIELETQEEREEKTAAALRVAYGGAASRRAINNRPCVGERLGRRMCSG